MGAEQAALAVAWALVGWALGLVLNRVIYQLPHERPVRETPRCPKCDRPISLLGRPVSTACPQCGSKTGYDRVEWAVAGLFLLLALFYGASLALLIYSLYTAVLVIIAAIDARHRYVYTIVTYPSILAALVLSPLLPGVTLTAPLVGLLVGGGTFLIFYLLGRLVYRGGEPLGTGDITIAALIGAMDGFPRVLSALFFGALASALIGVLAMLIQRRGRRSFIPYGPGLCAGAIAAFFMAP